METKQPNKEQTIILKNRQNLTISATNKIISLKADLIQLNTDFGGVIISGTNLELIKLDNATTQAEILGNVDSIKFTNTTNKTPFFKRIFK